MSNTQPLRHVAIIMDGNNRWAKERNMSGVSGHQAGAERLREVISGCFKLNIDVLTVYAFSSENWNRPKHEVAGLMSLFSSSLKRFRKELMDEGVRLRVIGRRDRFSARLVSQIEQVEADTAGGKYCLCIAADYGGRWDITESAKQLARSVLDGDISVDDITESSLNAGLSTADLPEPDLMIRTAGECRISNFLLWQLSYSEFYFADCYWPDFDVNWLNKAVDSYYGRERRFGERKNVETIES